MDEREFWSLIDLLGGLADEQTVPRVAEAVALLPEPAQQGFADLVAAHVVRLLNACGPMGGYLSDADEWLAAAALASGRSSYEAALATGRLAPEDWDWGEAEALLVVGPASGDVLAGNQAYVDTPIPLWWVAPELPLGVPQPDLWPDWFSGDPAFGHSYVEDPEWLRAWRLLASDREVGRVLGQLPEPVWFRVEETDRVHWWTWRSDSGSCLHLRCVPAALLLAASDRAEAYAAQVRDLVVDLPS